MIFFSFSNFIYSFGVPTIYIFFRNYYGYNTSFIQEVFCTSHVILGTFIFSNIIIYELGFFNLLTHFCVHLTKEYVNELKDKSEKGIFLEEKTILHKFSGILIIIKITNKIFEDVYTLYSILVMPVLIILLISF